MLIDDLVKDYNKSVNTNNKQIMYNIYININKYKDIKPHYSNMDSNEVSEFIMRYWIENDIKYKILKDDTILIKHNDCYIVHQLVYKDIDVDYRYDECEKEGVIIYTRIMVLKPRQVLGVYEYC